MIHLDGPNFKDEYGRVLILRGVNLGGSSKVPFTPNGATHIREGFFNHREVSFIGRPFPLDEADEHFARLRAWGYTFLRFLVTWEAIEHFGPGIYDEAYLDYVEQVVEKAGEYGIQVFIDPHQDVWSRFSGGDGAPGWTFEAAGMDLTRFAETGAAVIHALAGDPFPKMIWITNSNKLAAMTMFTLFFAGNDFAPLTRVEGEPVQEYLQRHYIAAFRQLAIRLKDLPNVVGYGAMNEPSQGMIGLDFSFTGEFRKGLSPTLWQAILLGAGFPQEIDGCEVGYTGIRRVGKRLVNPRGISVWSGSGDCLWKQNGVWDLDESGKPRLLRADYFQCVNGREVRFHRDYLKPFLLRFTAEIRSADPRAIIFLEGVPEERRELLRWEETDPRDVVYAAHWYDNVTLITKSFIPWFTLDIHNGVRPVLGVGNVQRAFIDQLADIRRAAVGVMNNCPVLLAEFGIPFDMHGGKAYHSGDFSRQRSALDRSFRAIEANLYSCTLWNYTADNTNSHGDQWNGEDLSIFSIDQKKGNGPLEDGGRALQAAVRPYPIATAGEPLHLSFNPDSGLLVYEFKDDPQCKAPTELYLPRLQYPYGCMVEVTDGEAEIDLEAQRLIYHPSSAKSIHRITLHKK